MQLETDEGTVLIKTPAELRDELRRLNTRNNRAILSTGDARYRQTAAYDDSFVIEKRDGSEDHHFHATYRGGREMLAPSSSATAKPRWWWKLFGLDQRPLVATHAFTQAEMIHVFETYFIGAPDPDFMEWVSGYDS